MLLLLAACADDPPADPTDSGGDPPTTSAATLAPVDAALADLPRCEPGSDDGALDVEAGCAGDVCLGTPWPEATATLGDPGSCIYIVDGAVCFWDLGLVISFADTEADGTPDDDATAYAIAVNPPFDGGTVDGLALDASLGCFVDALGDPDAVSFGHYDEAWLVRSLAWNDLFFTVYDFDAADGIGQPDGLPDFVQFTNYLYY
jgi:hypothetical protein